MTGKCQHYLQSLSDYVDGTLSEELCRELESHVAECENCRIVVNTLTKTVSLYHQLPSPEMPSDVRERLYKVLDIRSLYGGPLDDQEDHPAS
jgi:anti-sigma factor RsiW